MVLNIPAAELTADTLFNGRLVCRQFRQGYRFSVDAVLAAHFCMPGPGSTVLDLGCGCGVIGLILAYRHHDVRVTGLEVQPDLAALASQNAAANSLTDRIDILTGSLRNIGDFVAAESFDLVVSNPPYRQPGTGRISPTDQRARARHEIDATLEDVVQAASFAVRNRGRVIIIYPAVRAIPLIAMLRSKRLEPKRIQPVYSFPAAADAELVILEAVKNGGEEVRLLAPFYIYANKDGPYSEAMQTLYS